jgi:hypothetical protein
MENAVMEDKHLTLLVNAASETSPHIETSALKVGVCFDSALRDQLSVTISNQSCLHSVATRREYRSILFEFGEADISVWVQNQQFLLDVNFLHCIEFLKQLTLIIPDAQFNDVQLSVGPLLHVQFNAGIDIANTEARVTAPRVTQQLEERLYIGALLSFAVSTLRINFTASGLISLNNYCRFSITSLAHLATTDDADSLRLTA